MFDIFIKNSGVPVLVLFLNAGILEFCLLPLAHSGSYVIYKKGSPCCMNPPAVKDYQIMELGL